MIVLEYVDENRFTQEWRAQVKKHLASEGGYATCLYCGPDGDMAIYNCDGCEAPICAMSYNRREVKVSDNHYGTIWLCPLCAGLLGAPIKPCTDKDHFTKYLIRAFEMAKIGPARLFSAMQGYVILGPDEIIRVSHDTLPDAMISLAVESVKIQAEEIMRLRIDGDREALDAKVQEFNADGFELLEARPHAHVLFDNVLCLEFNTEKGWSDWKIPIGDTQWRKIARSQEVKVG